MFEYARIYHFYNLLLVRIIRLFVFIFLILFSIIQIATLYAISILFEPINILSQNIPLFFLSIFLMFEIFLRFKIARASPPLSLKDNQTKKIFDSFTLEALSIFVTSKSTKNIIKSLLNKSQVKFILQKGDFEEKDIKPLEIPKESLAKYAFETAKNLNGKFVTTMDLITSYLLLTEYQTNLLFNKKLKKEELVNILFWARNSFKSEEEIKPIRFEFWGEGIGESWVYGWTVETQKYMVDIASEALAKKPLLIGREQEYKKVVEALSNYKSVVLVGEPGSGKNTLVESLVFESFMGNLRGNLYHKRFYQLLVDTLLAGTQNQGELQERLDDVIAEISHSINIIIYIPNFESIMGSSTFNTDLSGVLIPYLQKGKIQFIASVTPSSYKRFIEPKHTLTNLLTSVHFEEPDKKDALQMLFMKTPAIEAKHKVSISYKGVLTANDFSSKYLPNTVMPGRGVTLLEDTANKVVLSGRKIVEEEDVISEIEEKTKVAIGKPKEKEKSLLLHLEDELHKYIINQKEAVFEISEALRRLRAGLTTKEKPISFLFLGPTGVGKTETAKALSKVYFGQESQMVRFDMSEFGESGSVNRFLGEEGEGLTDMVFDHPFSLVLLDEFEKSNPKIIDLFLQVLDDGRLTDIKGKTISFVDTIIIATSNAASEYIREEVNKGTQIDKNFQKNLLNFLQEKGIFRPEMLNRFDGVIVFKPLGEKEVGQIIKLLLKELSDKLLEKDIMVNFDQKIIEKISKEGFDEEFGARPLRRFIQDSIEDQIAKMLLKDEIKRGDKINLSVDGAGNFQIIKI
ncbi:MAG: ATP-dependent Clp protease ATP-binding subunit [Candidatus Levybacteria bacterium]|nr:ATP-dependent Clp protease ATP-binding subunit [Candidatus Levybacteria bacterium]